LTRREIPHSRAPRENLSDGAVGRVEEAGEFPGDIGTEVRLGLFRDPVSLLGDQGIPNQVLHLTRSAFCIAGSVTRLGGRAGE